MPLSKFVKFSWPQIVDRGKKVANYVRHGEKSASVEITLKQPVGSLVIKRSFDRNSTDSWEINGKKATKEQVAQVVKSNNIKLENMCHFLPQEKVQAFAEVAKKPTEMLKVVQAAVGPSWMGPLHAELIHEQKRKSRLMQDADAQSMELNNLQKREEALKEEMGRFERLQTLNEEMDVRKRKIPWVKVTFRTLDSEHAPIPLFCVARCLEYRCHVGVFCVAPSSAILAYIRRKLHCGPRAFELGNCAYGT